jgi:hypothetical protein
MNEINIYSDESRHRGERFLLLGGLWVRAKDAAQLEQEINRLRHKYGYTNNEGKFIDFLGELKWTKVSTKYLPIYKELVDLFFQLIEQGKIRFCAMLVDTHDPAVQEYDNIKKDGYFKLLYQLYLHNCRVPGIYNIFPDRITNPTHTVNLVTLQISLERALVKKFAELVNPGDRPERFVQAITPVDSKKVQMMQMVDVIIGAIGYFQNRHFKKEGAKKAKVELMKYIFDKLFYSGRIKIAGKKFVVARSTRFNIWRFHPKNKNHLP